MSQNIKYKSMHIVAARQSLANLNTQYGRLRVKNGRYGDCVRSNMLTLCYKYIIYL